MNKRLNSIKRSATLEQAKEQVGIYLSEKERLKRRKKSDFRYMIFMYVVGIPFLFISPKIALFILGMGAYYTFDFIRQSKKYKEHCEANMEAMEEQTQNNQSTLDDMLNDLDFNEDDEMSYF